MKTNLLKTIALAMVMTPFYNCSYEQFSQPNNDVIPIESTFELNVDDGPCSEQNPKTRITNNSNLLVNLEIEDINGDLLNYEYGLLPGETSEWKLFPVGTTTFKISTPVTQKNIVIEMGLCMAYELVIDENNHLNTAVPIQL